MKNLVGGGDVDRILGIMEEAAGYCEEIKYDSGEAKVSLRSRPIWYHFRIPVEAILDKNTSIDNYIGKTISILRTPQGYLFRVLEEAV